MNCALASSLPQVEALGGDLPEVVKVATNIDGKASAMRAYVLKEARSMLEQLNADEQESVDDGRSSSSREPFNYQDARKKLQRVEGSIEGNGVVEEEVYEFLAEIYQVCIGVLHPAHGGGTTAEVHLYGGASRLDGTLDYLAVLVIALVLDTQIGDV